jgi:hypothetical protein
MPRKPTTAAEPAIAHNSISAMDRDKLRSLVDPIESLEGERAAEDIRGI